MPEAQHSHDCCSLAIVSGTAGKNYFWRTRFEPLEVLCEFLLMLPWCTELPIDYDVSRLAVLSELDHDPCLLVRHPDLSLVIDGDACGRPELR
jgi:hypothetical protein